MPDEFWHLFGLQIQIMAPLWAPDYGTSLGSSPFPASAGAAEFIRDVEIAGGQQPSEPLWLNRKYLGFAEV